MKKYLVVPGFSKYRFYSDGTVTRDGKKVKINKGQAEFELTEPSEGLEVGKSYPMAVKDIIGQVPESSDQWISDEPATAEATPTAANTTQSAGLTPEQEQANAERDLLKKAILEKKKELTAAGKAVLDAKGEEALKLKEVYDARFAELEELEAKAKKNPDAREWTEAEKALIGVFEEAQKEAKDAKDALDAANAKVSELRATLPKGYKAGRTSNPGSDASKAPHLGYETAQAIRKDYAVGRYGNPGEPMSVSAIAEKYGCSQSVVNYKVNYLQHKLKKGDEAFTPLTNKYYPDGAPYAEDAKPEGPERYLLPEKRAEYLAKKNPAPAAAPAA